MEGLRLVLGILWIVAGVQKFVMLHLVPSQMLGMFVQSTLIPAYSAFIEERILPNAAAFIVTFGFLELIAGGMILHTRLVAKLGLSLAIVLNFIFLPLALFTIPINLTFIAAESWLLTRPAKKNWLLHFRQKK